MIEVKNDSLAFSFPEVHESANMSVNFQRTLRIPDNDKVYPLPPGLGQFPLVHVDDYANKVPDAWKRHGGVILPMYQAEAMWILFSTAGDWQRESGYPFAVKVSTGKIDAVTGAAHCKGLHRDPQDYLVTPGQPWIDGYCVKKGIIRQFVAMPLGEGYTAEEQITKKAEYGGIQIVVYPMKGKVYEKRFPKRERALESFEGIATGSWGSPAAPSVGRYSPLGMEMGLAPGGRMKQEIFRDRFDLADWDLEHSSRCFVHIANSSQWHEITGNYPPYQPPSANQYTNAGLPWFDYYDDNLKALKGSSQLANMKSVQILSQLWGNPTPNLPLIPKNVTHIKPRQVREGDF
jgi:hypothetical protein